MAPKIIIKYSRVYAENLYRGQEDFNIVWGRVKKAGEQFEAALAPVLNKILKYIPKFSGYKWEEHAISSYIDVYIVNYFPSFSVPLTLTADKNAKRMLAIFIHELCHNNMPFDFKNRSLQEYVMNSVTQRLAEELEDEELETEIRKIIERTRLKVYSSEFKEPSFELDKKTVKQYLSDMNFDKIKS